MEQVGNGPELMADHAAEFAGWGHFALQKRKASASYLPISMKKTSYYQRRVIIIIDTWHTVFSALRLNFRNQAKLQDYQRDYARRKRAPGRRKVSKAERLLLEEQHLKKQSCMEMDDLSHTPSAALSQCVLFSLAIQFLH